MSRTQLSPEETIVIGGPTTDEPEANTSPEKPAKSGAKGDKKSAAKAAKAGAARPEGSPKWRALTCLKLADHQGELPPGTECDLSDEDADKMLKLGVIELC